MSSSISSLEERIQKLEDYKVHVTALSSALMFVIAVLGLFTYTSTDNISQKASLAEEKANSAYARAEIALKKLDEVDEQLEEKKEEVVSVFNSEFESLTNRGIQRINNEANQQRKNISTILNKYEEKTANRVLNKFERKLKYEPLVVGKLIIANKHNEGVIIGVNPNNDGVITINSKDKKGKVVLTVENDNGIVKVKDRKNYTLYLNSSK